MPIGQEYTIAQNRYHDPSIIHRTTMSATMNSASEYYTTYKMNAFNSVLKVFEILHITSSVKALRTKRKRY